MTCCVIMHIMIMEDECEHVVGGLRFENVGDPIQLSNQNSPTLDEFVQMHRQNRHRATHEKLKHVRRLRGQLEYICELNSSLYYC